MHRTCQFKQKSYVVSKWMDSSFMEFHSIPTSCEGGWAQKWVVKYTHSSRHKHINICICTPTFRMEHSYHVLTHKPSPNHQFTESYMCIMSKYFTGTICLIISLSIHVAKYFLISEDGACFQCNITIRNFFIIHVLYNLTLCHVSFKNECRLLQVWFLDNPEFHTGIPFPVCVEKECDTHCHIR